MRKFIFLLTGLILVFSAFFLATGMPDEKSIQTAYDKPGPYALKSLEFPALKDANRNFRKVPLKVHYPVRGKNFPLIIMSHGGAGTWDSNIYQAEHLASHGYVVICVEHVYSNATRVKYYMSKAGGGLTLMKALHRITKDPEAVLERPKDVRFAIDQAFRWNRKHGELRGKINTKKIAVMGHSFGAYTTLVVVGAQPILDYLEPVVAPGKGLAGDLSDSRVTFGFAMSPQSPGTTFFNHNSYKTINRPLVCLTGSKDIQKGYDGRLMPPYTRWEVLKLLPRGEKYFLWLKNADHFSFSDSPRARIFPSKARPDAQRISKAMMVLFCDYFLKGKRKARDKLNEKYANSLCGRVVTSIQWIEK